MLENSGISESRASFAQILLFANYGGFRSEFNEATLSQLDMLKDAEALLMKAIQAAQDGRTQEIVNDGKKFSFIGFAPDGKKIFGCNYAEVTPKRIKSDEIVRLIQYVWSKKPIPLQIRKEGEEPRMILAKFDPDYDESGNRMTDAGKISRGNRNGSSASRRKMLNLGPDYYFILEDSVYLDSALPNEEDGEIKKPTHIGVKEWHYYGSDIYYKEKESTELIPFSVEIFVKEKEDGEFVYSFSENKKEPTHPRVIHTLVNLQSRPMLMVPR